MTPSRQRWTRTGLLLAVGLLSPEVIGEATVAAVSTDAVRVPPDIYGADRTAEPHLTSGDLTLPVDLSVAASDRATSQPPLIQAIPTPTAFQAGVVAMGAALLTRAVLVRRRRGQPSR